MHGWLRKQNSFTWWAAIGMASSASAGMAAAATFVSVSIASYGLGLFSPAWITVVAKTAEGALLVIGVSTVGFLISAVSLIASLFVETKPGSEQTEEWWPPTGNLTRFPGTCSSIPPGLPENGLAQGNCIPHWSQRTRRKSASGNLTRFLGSPGIPIRSADTLAPPPAGLRQLPAKPGLPPD